MPALAQFPRPTPLPHQTTPQQVQATLQPLPATPQLLHPMTVMKKRKTRRMSRKARRNEILSSFILISYLFLFTYIAHTLLLICLYSISYHGTYSVNINCGEFPSEETDFSCEKLLWIFE